MRSKLFVFVVLVTASASFTACGGSKNVSAETYASNVCAAASTWVQDLQRESQNVTTAVTGSPTQGKQLLSTLLEHTITSTDTLISALEKAGVPDVKDGDQISSALVDAFTQSKADLEKLRDDVANLSTSDPQAFASGAQALSTKLSQAFDKAGTSLDKLKSPELEKAGNSVQACNSLNQ
jgi:hypothetical protein